MNTDAPQESPSALPSGFRKGKLPKFDPSADELDKGLKSVESLFNEIQASVESGDDADLQPLCDSPQSMKFMVMRADGSLVDIAATSQKQTSFDTEAFGQEVAGFFDAFVADEESAPETLHPVPVVQLHSNGICELKPEVFAQILENRVAGKSQVAACAELEQLLKAVQVLTAKSHPSLEVYAVEDSKLVGVYPAAGRSLSDGAPLISARSQKGATGRFLKEGQKFESASSSALIQDVLGKFFVTQHFTIQARPEPAVAAISIDDLWATLLEGLFKHSVVSSKLKNKRIVGVGLYGEIAMVFHDLNHKSTLCDRNALRDLLPILSRVAADRRN